MITFFWFLAVVCWFMAGVSQALHDRGKPRLEDYLAPFCLPIQWLMSIGFLACNLFFAAKDFVTDKLGHAK